MSDDFVTGGLIDDVADVDGFDPNAVESDDFLDDPTEDIVDDDLVSTDTDDDDDILDE